jgi:hypothetical protein
MVRVKSSKRAWSVGGGTTVCAEASTTTPTSGSAATAEMIACRLVKAMAFGSC